MIKGDLTINDLLHDACVNGKSWAELLYSDTIYIPDDRPASQFSGLNDFFDQLFFAEAASKCNLEIYSPSGIKIKEYKNLSAEGIKEGLNLGIVVGPISDSGNDVQTFIVKIRKQSNSAVLLETNIKTLNPSSGIGIYADYIRDKSITPSKLITHSVVDSGVSDNGKVLSWDGINKIMDWEYIGSENLGSDIIQWTHLSGPVKALIRSKLSKSIYTADPVIEYPDDFEASNKYLQIPITENGTTTMYYLRLSTLKEQPPILNIAEDSIQALIGQTIHHVDAIIDNIKKDSVSPKAEIIGNQGYYNILEIVGSPEIVTEGGVEKARVYFKCNEHSAYASDQLKIKISANPYYPQYQAVSDTVDVNCYSNQSLAPSITILNEGVIMIVGKYYPLAYTAHNVASVAWSAIPSPHYTFNTIDGVQNIKCNTVDKDISITATGNPNYNWFPPATDTFGASCVASNEGGQPPGTCFLAGTKVYTTNGWKNIETIKSGEKVYSYSDDGKLVETNVKSLLIHDYVNAGDKSVKLELSNNIVLFVTSNHAFYSPTEKKYKQLKTFNIGDDLLYYHVTKNAFENVQISKITELPSFSKVYNLALDKPNNYLAEGIVVHNREKEGEVTIPQGGDESYQ